MNIRDLYRYINEETGTVTFSLTKPEDEDYEIWFRLTANKDRMITKDGENFFFVIDVENTEGWCDVEYNEDLLHP